MRTKNARIIQELLLIGFVLIALFLFSLPTAVFAADPNYHIYTGADSVVCTEPNPDEGRVYFDVTASYSVLPDPSAGTQQFIRRRQLNGVTYSEDYPFFSLYGSGVYIGTSHPPFTIPAGAISYLFTLEEVLVVNGVETSISAITIRCDEVIGAAAWVGTVVSITGDPDIDEVDSGPGGPPSDPGDVVPDNPSGAGGHANENACDNPAEGHRPDNLPPCREP
jgi:hypothetical protein